MQPLVWSLCSERGPLSLEASVTACRPEAAVSRRGTKHAALAARAGLKSLRTLAAALRPYHHCGSDVWSEVRWTRSGSYLAAAGLSASAPTLVSWTCAPYRCPRASASMSHQPPIWHNAIERHKVDGWPTARMFIHSHALNDRDHRTAVVTALFDDSFDRAAPDAYARAVAVDRNRIEAGLQLILKCRRPRIIVTSWDMYKRLWALCCAQPIEPPAGLGFIVTLNAFTVFRHYHQHKTATEALDDLLSRKAAQAARARTTAERDRVTLSGIALYASKTGLVWEGARIAQKLAAGVRRGCWVRRPRANARHSDRLRSMPVSSPAP